MQKSGRLSWPTITTCLLLSLSLVLSGCGGAKDREDKYLKRAQEHYDGENYAKAKVEAKNALQINPKNSDARYILGMSHLQVGEFKQAFSHFNSAVLEDPATVKPREELAKIYFSGKQYEKTTSLIDEILALEPDNSTALGLKAGVYSVNGNDEAAEKLAKYILEKYKGDGRATAVLVSLYSKNNPERALQLIEEALAVEEKPTFYLMKIGMLSQMGRVEEIEPIYKKLIVLDPHTIENYDKLAAFYASQNRYDDVLSVMDSAITNNPESSDARIAKLKYIENVKGFEQAEVILKQYIKEIPDNYTYIQFYSLSLARLGREDKAKVLLKNIIKENPASNDAVQARIDLANWAFRDERIDDVKSLLKEVFEIERNNAKGLVIQARLDLRDKHTDDAIANLRAAVKNDSSSTEALKLLAMAHESKGNNDLAYDSYSKVLELDNSDVISLVRGAKLSLLLHKNSDHAEKLLNRLLDIQPNSLEAITLLMSIYVDSQRWKKADDLLKPLLESPKSGNQAFGALLSGNVLLAKKEWGKARDMYKEALRLFPNSDEAISGVVNSYLNQNKTSEAITFVKGYLADNKDQVKVRRLLASLLVLGKQYEDAEVELEKVLAQDPETEKNYLDLARIFLLQERKEDAESVYVKGLKRNPEFSAIRLQQSVLYTLKGEYKKALEGYEMIYKSNPENTSARNNLAILLVDHLRTKENIARAFELVSGFEHSKEPNYLDTLGWVHYHMDNYPQAISYLQSAIQIRSQAEFHYHLGMVYKKSGQLAAAQKELSAATGSESTAPWFEIAKAELGAL